MALTPASLLSSLFLLAFAGAGIENASLKEIRILGGSLHHVQGIDLDRDHFWVTSVDAAGQKGYLDQFNRATAKFERRLDVTDGPRFHPGGFSMDGDSIWVPVAEYKPHSTAVLEEIDKRTLAIRRKIAVADHIGCVAATGESLIAGNWDSRQLYVFNLAGRQLQVINNPEQNRYQDMKFAGGMLIASGVFNRSSGAIDWFTWPAMKRVRRVRAGRTDRGVPYTQEAMAIQGSDLYLVPEDGPSRLFHFILTAP
ncbi:MAG TPA: DUF6454 family protein [Bryobacteraceae bacterium]|jgi:hypothetical protein|nr:DUF6454 family protein [Bryobacteraceae bacterium]